jgi:hypothetical protein
MISLSDLGPASCAFDEIAFSSGQFRLGCQAAKKNRKARTVLTVVYAGIFVYSGSGNGSDD